MICGFGEVGEGVAASAVASGVLQHQILVIDQNQEHLRRAAGCGYRTVAGDPPFVDAISPLGGTPTRKVVICVDDALAAETVRALRVASPHACVQVVLETSEAEDAVAIAGADLVLSLSRLAGRLMAASAMSGELAIGAVGSG